MKENKKSPAEKQQRIRQAGCRPATMLLLYFLVHAVVVHSEYFRKDVRRRGPVNSDARGLEEGPQVGRTSGQDERLLPYSYQKKPNQDGSGSSSDENRLDIDSQEFKKCYDLLESTASGGRKLYRPHYLQFLRLLTNGAIDYSRLTELPAPLYVLFWATACAHEECTRNMIPYIEIDDDGKTLSLLRFFCQEVLAYTSVSVSTVVSFEFSIRYNPNTISKEKASQCLSSAIENLLLEHFDCLPDEASERRLTSSSLGNKGNNKLNNKKGLSFVEESSRKLMIRQRSISSSASAFDMGPEHCAYKVESGVEIVDFGKKLELVLFPMVSDYTRIDRRLTKFILTTALSLFADCIPSAPGLGGTECGLAQSTVKVTAEQMDSEQALNDEVTQALRDAINGGTVQDFFPPDCQLQA